MLLIKYHAMKPRSPTESSLGSPKNRGCREVFRHTVLSRHCEPLVMWFAGAMTALESAMSRALSHVTQRLVISAKNSWLTRQSRDSARTLLSSQVVDELLADMTPTELKQLDRYLASPDFEEIALQYLLGRMLKDEPWEKLQVNVRHEIRHSVRNHVSLIQEDLLITTDAIFDALKVASLEVPTPTANDISGTTAAAAAHLVAASAANSRLLQRVSNLAAAHEFADHLRAQVISLHGHMRLPHLGVSRAVPYDELYVAPLLQPEKEPSNVPDLATLPLPGRRSVILGDPGAGKSTLAAKVAHDVAADIVEGAEGRVPFLLVLREFAGLFREGGKGLVQYLEQACRAPYNLEPPPDAVAYLLGNGRAMVLLDGLDELVEPELRRRFVQLVHGFVARFPLAPILVTARRIGYSDVPLDRGMFSVGVVSDLTDEQVERYTQRWFALDASTAERDRAQMATSFVAESRSIAELRANPLLLALLCAMYSSEHYIPTNLAQIYERCAVMLFDRWDIMRGISEGPQFHGRLRGAIQYLAWKLFTADELTKALPQHRLLHHLASYLVAKQFDEDDAIATAEQFVDFCTGRAWILTDVGATDSEPRYGFTHRTFLEFFAAEYLVRSHPTPEQLWETLRPRIRNGDWEIVTQVALQLLDRNVDDGADGFLRLVMADLPNAALDRAGMLSFAARVLGHVHPGHAVIRAVVDAALDATLAPDVNTRYRYWHGVDDDEALRAWDEALHTLMYRSSPGNRSIVHRTLTTRLSKLVDYGDDAACFVITHLGRNLNDADRQTAQFWISTQLELQQRHASALAAWNERAPWANVAATNEPERIIPVFGAWPLYMADLFLTGSLPSIVERVFHRTIDINLTALLTELLRTSKPWIAERRWWHERSGSKAVWHEVHSRLTAGVAWKVDDDHADLAMLYLPYLESYLYDEQNDSDVQELPNSLLVHELAIARRHGVESSNLYRVLQECRVAEEVQSFLASWARKDFDVVISQP